MELLVQDTSLIAIADAIREKAETTGELAFPNGFVEAISALGGLPNGVTALASGTYTPTSWIKTPVQIEHGMSITPNVAFYAIEGDLTVDPDITNYIIMGIDMSKNITIPNLVEVRTGHTYICRTGGGDITIGGSNIDDSYITLYGSNDAALRYGKTYRWLAAYVEGL